MYFLQLANSQMWDEVSEFVYNNWDKVVVLTGEDSTKTYIPRYNGNRLTVINGKGDIDATQLDKSSLAVIMRLCGVKDSYYPINSNGGFIKKPEMIKMEIRKRIALHDVASGENFYPRSAEKPKELVTA